MWLVDTETLKLKFFASCPTSQYAILSHTWGEDEPTFSDLRDGTASHKEGFRKIKGCCKRAKHDKLSYAWIDTCCIDKTSSAELSEAINSMFDYYSNAKVCYAFIADLTLLNDRFLNEWSKGDTRYSEKFRRSRWFERGWTLQELLAPKSLIFFDSAWRYIGSRDKLASLIWKATGIQKDLLRGERHKNDYSIAQRMSWASRRNTTRIEDIAYSLLGIFDVNMPLLYGEGMRAFVRLQENIIQNSDDETIFAWSGVGVDGAGLLASSPAQFADARSIKRILGGKQRSPFFLTNRGLALEAELVPCAMNTYSTTVAVQSGLDSPEENDRLQIFVGRTAADDQYRRVLFHDEHGSHDRSYGDHAIPWDLRCYTKLIYVPNDSRAPLMSRGSEPVFHFTLRKLESTSNLHLEYYTGKRSIAVKMRATGPENRDSAGAIRDFSSQAGSKCRGAVFDGRVKTLIVGDELNEGVQIEFSAEGHDRKDFPLCGIKFGFDPEFRPICYFLDHDHVNEIRREIWKYEHWPLHLRPIDRDEALMADRGDAMAFRGHRTTGLQQEIPLPTKNGWLKAHLDMRPCRKEENTSGLHWNVILTVLTVSYNRRVEEDLFWHSSFENGPLTKNQQFMFTMLWIAVATCAALVLYLNLYYFNPIRLTFQNLYMMANWWLDSPELQTASIFLAIVYFLTVSWQGSTPILARL